MSYNREGLFNLPVEEKLELVMDLRGNTNEEFPEKHFQIQIIAVFDHSRNPREWEKRI